MILGLCGSAGSGKDTCADFLATAHDWKKVALADPIKRAARDFFGWSEERLWGPSEERNKPDPDFGGLSARKACQHIGTEVGRELYPDVWVKKALSTATILLSSNAYSYDPRAGLVISLRQQRTRGVVISDVRFRNEVDAIRAVGGYVVRLVRPGSGLSGAASVHQSETELTTIPEELFLDTIVNDGTIDEMHVKLVRLVGPLLRE